MKIHHILLLCFLTALCGLVRSKLNVYTGAKGGSGTVNCRLPLPGNMRFFCKNECKGEDVLIKTDAVRATSGKYRTSYREEVESERGTLSVTITDLTESDSGRYRCGLGTSIIPDATSDFEVRVSDKLLNKKSGFIPTSVEGDTLKNPCFKKANMSRFFFCKDECKKEEDILIETDQKSLQRGRYSIEYIEGSAFGLYVNITQVTKSDMGQYKCGYGRALSKDSSSITFTVIVIDAPTTSKPAVTKVSSESATVFSSSSVFSDPTDRPAAAALTSSKPNWTLVPLTSSAATTAGLRSVSGSYSPSSAFPETTNRPEAAAPTTRKPSRTLWSSLTSFSSATPQSSGSSKPSPVFSETTNQPAAAALTTSKPNQTLQPFPTSAATSSASTTHTLSSRSESSTATADPDTISWFTAFSYVPRPDNVLPLAVGLPVVGVLLLGAFLLLLHLWKTKKNKGETVI